jgi:hypothetical protein
MTHLDDMDEPEPEFTLAAFIEAADPALAAWSKHAPSTEDIRLAIALGELSAAFELVRISRDHDNVINLEHALQVFLAGRAALRRRRDSMRFVRALTRHLNLEGEHDGPETNQ